MFLRIGGSMWPSNRKINDNYRRDIRIANVFGSFEIVILYKTRVVMTQELVDKVRAYVEARRIELENSPNSAELARDHLRKIGYLDENNEVSAAYRGGIPDNWKKAERSI